MAVIAGMPLLDWVMAGRVSRKLGRSPRTDSQATIAGRQGAYLRSFDQKNDVSP